MAATCSTAVCSRTEKERQTENEVFLEAIKNCDDDTYLKIISILEEAGLLPE
mgnify:CR=1 FL=1